MPNAYDVIRTKRDTRAYSARPVPEATLHRILQAGRMAGSSKNSQPCRFVVIRDPARLRSLAECGDFATHLPNAVVAVAVLLLPDGRPFDAGRAAQNMMLAAWAEGVTSCPTSMHRNEDAARVLKLPEGWQVATVLPFAYPDEAAPARESRPRLPLEQFVYEDHYQDRP